jgi:tubulin monoglycylase TTLL3/8
LKVEATKLKKVVEREESNSDDADDGNDDIDEDDDQEENDKEGGADQKTGAPNSIKKKKNSKKPHVYSFITDIDVWRKKMRLDPSTKVFIILGGYHDLKKALLRRGWVQNPDNNSSCYDLKWTLKAKDIDHNKLQDFQIVNHFEKNTSITTKVGLCRNLRNLIWFNNVDIDTFYPTCFDMGDTNDFDDFVEYFKVLKAEGCLKTYIQMYNEKNPELKSMEGKVKVALAVSQRRLRDLDDIIDQKVNFLF